MTADTVRPGAAHDVALMIRVRHGDEQAFAELYRRYYRKLLDFFYGMSHDVQTAEDLCQETFLRVWKLRHRYAATGSFTGYLFAFGRNIWLEKYRKMKKRNKLGIQRYEQDIHDWIAVGRQDYPDEAASRSELENRVYAALDRLPEQQRMVFVLRTVKGLSTKEISSIMGCPVNTVRSRKILAIQKLRRALRGMLVL